MINLILGISLTLNVVFIIGIFLYFKIKFLGMKKFQKEMTDKFFVKDDDFDDMLNNL